MDCPNCKKLMELEDYTTVYHDYYTMMLTEHYWCSHCDKRYKRFAIYQLARNQINEVEDEEN